MKDLLSQEHSCYEIHALLIKRSVCPPLLQTTSLYEVPAPPPPHPILIFTRQENLDPPFYDFSKIHGGFPFSF